MAGSSNNNLDSPSFSGSYSKMERSGSFREGLENRTTNTSRSAQLSSEIPPLSQYLNLDPVSMLGEQQKYSKSGELRRVLGISLEDHSFGSALSSKVPVPEELKRFKGSLVDSSTRARERAKFFQEAITNVDKYRNVVSKRRQRNEMSSEKSSGSSFSKLNGPQAHQGPSGEVSGPKNLVPNKRARSSLSESRSEGRGMSSVRQASVNNTEKPRANFEKDKNTPGKNAANEEDKPRGLAPASEGWEKKLKRKRSVGSMVNRANDSEPKSSTQSRSTSSNTETRARFNDNSLGFRSGLPGGNAGTNKTDGSSQQSSGSGPRASAKSDNDNHSSERRERPLPLDKDRTLLKGNKLVSRDEPQSSSGMKTKASRAPRSSSFVVMNSSPSFGRFPGASTSDAWDPPVPPSKSQSPSNSNRKRSAPPVGPPSPSPPVAQWGGQRPHKIQRTRRAHVVSPVSNFDDVQTTPTNEAAPSPSISNSTFQQRGNRNEMAVTSSPVGGLSESEESKGKGNENGEDSKATTTTSMKKNSRALLKEEIGDGVRRQGRTGRGGASHARSLLSVPKDKVEVNESVPKPPKSGGRPSTDKNDSRIGRPPLKKAVDRKSHGRPAQNIQTGSLDMTGEQEDDKEELMAAINAARNACQDASTGTFWKKMETVFSLPTPEDLLFLKNQIAFAEELDKSASDILVDTKLDSSEKVVTDEWFEQAVPLSQRLLSAIITIDGSDDLLVDNGIENNHYSYENKGAFCNGYGVDGFLEGNNGVSSLHRQNGGTQSQNGRTDLYECRFEEMSFDDRILLELHSIGIFPDNTPELDEGECEIDKEILALQNKLTEQVKEKKTYLQKLEKAILQDVKGPEHRNLEQIAMNKLVERASKKLSGGRGGSNHKNSGGSKVSKQVAQAFAKRTLARCHKFEQTGRSCFSDPSLRDALFAPLPRPDSKPTDSGIEKSRKPERGPLDVQRTPDQTLQKERGKKREVLLDEVSRGAATSSFGPKWKKTDQIKDGSTKNSNAKGGTRGERKNKAKPKQQKLAHLSGPPNCEPGSGSGTKTGKEEPVSAKPVGNQTKDAANDGLFAELPLSLDDLDVAGDGQDLGSWLNVDDETLQDTDLVGLQIPMDDLADLTFT